MLKLVVVAGARPNFIKIAPLMTALANKRACTPLLVHTGQHYDALMSDTAANAAAGIRAVTRIGDCLNPGTVAAAIHGGHRHARELDAPPADLPFRVEHARYEGTGMNTLRPSTSSG